MRDLRWIATLKWPVFGLSALLAVFYSRALPGLHPDLALVAGLVLILLLAFVQVTRDYDFAETIWYSRVSTAVEGSALAVLVGASGGASSPFGPLLPLSIGAMGLEVGAGWAAVVATGCTGILAAFAWSGPGGDARWAGMTGLAGGGLALFGAVLAAQWLARSLQAVPEPEAVALSAVDRANEQSRLLVRQAEEREKQLYEERRKLYTLMEVAQQISVTRRPDELLSMIVKSAREQIGAGIAMVLMRREGELVVARSSGLSQPTARLLRTRIGEGLFGMLVQSESTFHYTVADGWEPLEPYAVTMGPVRALFAVPDPSQAYDAHHAQLDRFRNLLVMPLKTPQDKAPFGLLVVANRLVGERFLSEDLGYLRILAAGAAISLCNARLLAEVETSYKETIVALAQAIEAKDPYTNEHVLRVASHSEMLARSLGLPEEQVELIYKAAILHDVGKISTPDRILGKKGALTDEEFEIMKAHAARGAEILAKIRSLPNEVLKMVRHHHERWDGKGYPDGLNTDNIPLGAQIISVADCYDAMTSDRIYRKGFSHEDALRRMENGYGTQFSPQVLVAFFALHNHVPAKLRGGNSEAAGSPLAGVVSSPDPSAEPSSQNVGAPARVLPRVIEIGRPADLETGKEPAP